PARLRTVQDERHEGGNGESGDDEPEVVRVQKVSHGAGAVPSKGRWRQSGGSASPFRSPSALRLRSLRRPLWASRPRGAGCSRGGGHALGPPWRRARREPRFELGSQGDSVVVLLVTRPVHERHGASSSLLRERVDRAGGGGGRELAMVARHELLPPSG